MKIAIKLEIYIIIEYDSHYTLINSSTNRKKIVNMFLSNYNSDVMQ